MVNILLHNTLVRVRLFVIRCIVFFKQGVKKEYVSNQGFSSKIPVNVISSIPVAVNWHEPAVIKLCTAQFFHLSPLHPFVV